MSAPAEHAEHAEHAEDPDDGRLLAHTYDGIREYDNPLPGWWSLIFALTIAFAAAYAFYFHVAGWGATPDERYAAQLERYEGTRGARELAEAAHVSEDSLARAAQDPAVVARGAQVYAQRCASCHAADGGGLIGPNLTDLAQVHGSTRMDLFATVRKGVPGTAMLAWGEQLPRTDVVAVSVFAATLRGQNRPGKPPQGQPVARFAP